MDRTKINAELKRRGITHADVAKKLGVSRSAVTNTIGGIVMRRVALEISHLIGIPVSRLWPGKYPRIELQELRRAA